MLPGEPISAYVARTALLVPVRGDEEPVGDWRIRAVRERLGLSLMEAVETVRRLTA